ncbi:hypothetical protein GALMADRAFT_259156 [Galerina marginata CBS 339.88]|uniref:Fe2OG dioxygenase domain-containing protein n=1 Tax=Galerina marginata (strain CBS 339.88) TaxID=685588 RepID=A0A067S914_GALM3|nr:hypothetical protein GALMADRAFT_259156 [Galerina marginata CBS 339.88]
MYAPAPRMPISRSSSPVPGSGQYYGQPPIGRSISRGPSPVPPGATAGQNYYTYSSPSIGRPISRGPSPAPGVGRPTGFQVEKRAKSPNPYGRPPTAQPEPAVYRDEMMYREHVSNLIGAKDRQIAVSGRIPVDPAQLSLFFRAKTGITYSLDFPVDLSYTTPPAFDVLVAACRPRPRQMSDYDGYGDREALSYPPNLPLTASLEVANYPILDAVRSALFPVLPAGQYLTAVRDGLDVVEHGSYISTHSPAQLRKDQRAATILVTLPVRYRGGVMVISDAEGKEEKFQGSGGKSGEIDWMAFRSDCAYAVEPVQNGCLMTISYGVYVKAFGPSSPAADTLITPTDSFFDLLSPILNMSRGRSVAFHLNYDYNINPAEVLANAIVPQLKGADALLYDAFKFHKLTPELHWTAGGFIWPADHNLEFFGEDINRGNNPIKNSPNLGRTPFGSINGPRGTVPPVRGAFGGYPDPNSNEEEVDAIRSRVQASGGVSLAEANITLLTDYKNPAPSVGRERVYFVSNGELEKLVVNILLVVYIP